MRKNLIALLLGIFAFNVSAQMSMPPDSTYYYLPNGTKSWWYVQKDMASFRLNSGVAYTGAVPTYVDTLKHLPTTYRKQNLIKFNASASILQKATFINAVSTTTNYEWFAPVVSQTKNLPYTSDKWVNTMDLILVKFRSPAAITPTALTSFMSRNNLTLDHQPSSSLPNPNAWTFIFKINKDSKAKNYGDVFSVCQYIFVNEAGFVTHCEPGMYLYKPDVCQNLPNEFSVWGAYAPSPDKLWHIRNQGNQVGYSSFTGVAGADAKVCECWSDGFHGENINVAVIDGGNYDFNHTDLIGQFLTGYNFLTNTPITASSFVNNNSTHGMQVASVIVALENTGQTISQSANYSGVGVAYKSKVIPYITDYSNAKVVQAIQKSVLDGADVVNMSFSYEDNSSSTQSSTMYSDIKIATQSGRAGKGTVFVGSTGNVNHNAKCWPAADRNVIGTGATDPNDYRGTYLNTQSWTWSSFTGGGDGSNYLTPSIADTIRYDVVAPGTLIYTALTQNTTPQQTFIPSSGTSEAAPIVSGIAAILLSKYPNLTFQQVINTINNTADKIRPLSYNYNQFSSFLPNYAQETFYGRINCINALLNPAVGISENAKTNNEIKLAYISQNEALILFNQNSNPNGFTLSVIDMSGKLIDKKQINANQSTFTYNAETLVEGVYLFQLNNKKDNSIKAFKYIK